MVADASRYTGMEWSKNLGGIQEDSVKIPSHLEALGNPMKKPCACKICGEIGHTQEEHKDGCPHCEEKHPAEECPTSQVTCFLCEGTTHYPTQCHIYPVVQQTIQEQEEGMKEALREVMKEPVIKESVEDPDGESLNRFYSNACYSCGEEGHFS